MFVCECVYVFFLSSPYFFFFFFYFWLSLTIVPNCSLCILWHSTEKANANMPFIILCVPLSAVFSSFSSSLNLRIRFLFFVLLLLLLFCVLRGFNTAAAYPLTPIQMRANRTHKLNCLSFHHFEIEMITQSPWLESINKRKTHKEIYIFAIKMIKRFAALFMFRRIVFCSIPFWKP